MSGVDSTTKDKVSVRDLAFLFLLSLAVRLAMAALIARPGYMDTAYYAAGAVRLAEGGGLNEPFIWNYLDDPAGVPHPGFGYWMPLPSLLAALPALLFPGSFFALQLPSVFLSALLPLLGYGAAWQVSGVRRRAWVAGLLTLFSGFFFPYWTLPETFAPFALFGALALWFGGRKLDAGCLRLGTGRWVLDGRLRCLLVGLLVGLAHLTRADGVLLLPVMLLGLLLDDLQPASSRPARRSLLILHCSLLIVGYLLAMGSWFARSVAVAGAPLSLAGSRTLWLTAYDDLFCYGCDLSPQAYLAWGWDNILSSKLSALSVNGQRFLAENCLVFLLPFVLVGLYRLRRRLPFLLSAMYVALAFALHSLAFAFPGPRGGFFHASAAALPFLFAAGVEGMDAAVEWAARRRRWNRRQALAVFEAAAVAAAVALSGAVAADKLPATRHADQAYLEVDGWLDARGVVDSTMVMVGNPPAFWYHTHRPAVVVPNGGVDVLLVVADRYGVSFVLLDHNRPQLLGDLYAGETSHPRLRVAETWGEGAAQRVLYEVVGR